MTICRGEGIEVQSDHPDWRVVNRGNHNHLCAAGAPDVGRRGGVAVLLIDHWEVSFPNQSSRSL